MEWQFNVLLVDEHAAFRQPLARILEREPTVAAVLEVGTFAAARSVAAHVDVCVTELALPDGSGLDLIRDLVRGHRGIRILVLTAASHPLLLARAVEAGAAGLLAKHATLDEVLTAVRRLGRGQWLLSPQEMSKLISAGREERRRQREVEGQLAALTKRELEVLEALAQGLSDKEVASRLRISVETVRSHLVNVFSKLQVESRLQAVLFALRHRVVQLT